MTLYYEDKQATIEAIKKHGPVAVLSSHAQMELCDRSLINEGPADEPVGTPLADVRRGRLTSIESCARKNGERLAAFI